MRANERGAYVGDICVSGVRLSKSHQCTQGTDPPRLLRRVQRRPPQIPPAIARAHLLCQLMPLSVRSELLQDLHSDVGAGLPCQ